MVGSVGLHGEREFMVVCLVRPLIYHLTSLVVSFSVVVWGNVLSEVMSSDVIWSFPSVEVCACGSVVLTF